MPPSMVDAALDARDDAAWGRLMAALTAIPPTVFAVPLAADSTAADALFVISPAVWAVWDRDSPKSNLSAILYLLT